MRAARVTIVCVALTGLAFSWSCSAQGRYRVLSFFFDGVPEPGSDEARAVQGGARAAPESGPAAAGPVRPARLFVHTPYRDNRCASCHDLNTGGMVCSLSDGLCVTCHRELVETPRYLHGPVAVMDCTACHHYHYAPRENLLLEEVNPLCQGCHVREDLSGGPHHAVVDDGPCTECHDPHGGDDPYFTRRKGS